MKTRATKSKRYPLVAIPERSGKKLRLPRQKAFKSEYIQKHGCSLVAESIALQWWGVFKPMTSLQKWHKKHTPERYHPKVTVEAVAEGLREIAGKGEDEVVFYRKVTVERIERSINRGHLVIVEWGDPIHTVVLVPDTGGKCYLANHGTISRYSPETAAVKATTNKKYRGMIICKDLKERGGKMKSRVIEIEHRGMKAWAFGSMMRIQTLSGMTVGGTNDWHGAGLKGQEAKTEQLRKDLDKFIALEWFFLRHGGREDGLYRARETR